MGVKLLSRDIFDSNRGKVAISKSCTFKFKRKEWQGSDREPMPFSDYWESDYCDSDFYQKHYANFPVLFVYKNNLYSAEKLELYTEDEKKLMIKEHYYKHNEKFSKLIKAIKLFESLETKNINHSREPIPEQVRFSVWRRDEGKCIQCGSNKGLEFDHIIPFSKGGSNTERNLQLLCEKCNRTKSAKI